MNENPAFVSNAKLRQTVNISEKLHVAAYIRVSTDSSDQENSYERQERYFTSLLNQHESWISAGVYADRGMTGTNNKRPGFKRLLRHCLEGKINRIICKSISRFARNTADFLTALHVLHDYHVTILFERENLDTVNPVSDFILTTLAAIAQEESRSISENKLWGFRKRFPNGDVPNEEIFGYRFVEGKGAYRTLPSGYRLRQIEIVEEEAMVVRRIFAEVAEGKTYISIARELNLEHIPAPSGKATKKGKRYAADGSPAAGSLKEGINEGWTGRRIGKIIQSERYTGDVIAQKTYTENYLTHRTRENTGELPIYYICSHHPPIISHELYEKVQRIRRINSLRYGHSESTMDRKSNHFASLFLCASCGRFFQVRNTKKNPIWFCPTSSLNNGMDACKAGRVYEAQLTRMLCIALANRFTDFDSSSHLLDAMQLLQQNDSMEKDISFRKHQIAALEFDLEDIEKRIELLSGQIEALKWEQRYPGESTTTDEMLQKLEKHLIDEQRKFDWNQAMLKGHRKELSTLIRYWEDLEARYEFRERAIYWMQEHNDKKEGREMFLQGFLENHVKAFVMKVIVYDSLSYTVHWFDGTKTNVELENDTI